MKKWCICMMVMLLGIFLAGCNNGEKEEQNIPDTNEITKEPSNDEIKVEDENLDSQIKEVLSVEALFLNGVITYYDEAGTYETDPFISAERVTASFNYGGDYSQVISMYDIDKDDDEQLCAFVVHVGSKSVGYLRVPKQEEDETDIEYNYRQIGYMEDALRQRGIYILEDYPYCYKYKAARGITEFSDEEYDNVYKYGCRIPKFAVVGTMKDIVELCKDNQMVDGWYLQFMSAPRPDIVEEAREAGDYVFGDYQSFEFSNRAEILGEEKIIAATVEVS